MLSLPFRLLDQNFEQIYKFSKKQNFIVQELEHSIKQACTNAGRQVAMTPEIFMMAPRIFFTLF
jgi:hypothetical protein